MDLAGRRAELRQLLAWVDEALAGGAPRLVLVGGEAGIGKSHLVGAVEADLAAKGVTTAVGLVAEQAGAPPYWPWRQIEEQLGGGDLFGATAGTDPEAERFARFSAVRAWLGDRARGADGLVVVVEDLHRADPDSRALLVELVAHLRDEPLVVLVTHRSTAADASPGFAAAIDRLRTAPVARRLDLEGLDQDAVRDLLASAVPTAVTAGVVERVAELTGGNPLFVGELGRHLAGGATVDTVPASIREAVTVRLDRCPPGVAEVLRTASVLGRDFAAGVVATAREVPVLEVLRALDEATAAGFVEAGARAGRFRFVHALLRDAIEATIGAADLPLVHRRVAEAIEEYEGSGDDHLADLAHHWEQASVAGDRAVAATWAERAAVAADHRLAWQEAARLFDRAVELDPSADPVTRHRRLLGSARARLHVDDIDEVVARCRRAAEAVRGLGRPDLLAEAALVAEERGGQEATLRAVRDLTVEARQGLGPDHAALRARLTAQLASLAFYLDPAACVALSAEALAEADRVGDPLAVVAATRARQMAVSVPEGVEERLALAERMDETGRALGRPMVTVWASVWRIDALVELGRVTEAAAELPELTRRVAIAAVPMAQWLQVRIDAALAQATGRFADALAAGERARELFAVLESPMGAENMDLRLRSSIGDHLGHDPTLFERWEHFPMEGYPSFLGDLPVLSRVKGALDAGQREDAEHTYDRLPAPATWSVPPFLEVAMVDLRLRCAVALGRVGDVVDLAGRLADHRGRHATSCGGTVSYDGCVELHLGEAAAALGRLDDAVDDLAAAVEIARGAGTPGFVVEGGTRLAEVLIRRDGAGDAERAASLVAEHRPTAVRLGMHPWVDRLDGVAVDDAPAAAAHPLSPREREVAALVAEGLTNRQIAARLFVSDRTAQNHVQHILTKLGLDNRTQIAAWVHDRT